MQISKLPKNKTGQKLLCKKQICFLVGSFLGAVLETACGGSKCEIYDLRILYVDFPQRGPWSGHSRVPLSKTFEVHNTGTMIKALGSLQQVLISLHKALVKLSCKPTKARLYRTPLRSLYPALLKLSWRLRIFQWIAACLTPYAYKHQALRLTV